MAPMYGMNTAEVDSLAASLEQASTHLSGVAQHVDHLLALTNWTGNDASQFTQAEWPVYRRRILTVGVGLAEFARVARQNADEQRAASAAGSASGTATGAGPTTIAGVPGSYKWKRDRSPLYRKGRTDSSAVDPDDVIQGRLGDCYLLANLKALAQADPRIIERMIRDNHNGTYTVTFYEDGHPVEVTVTNEFPTEVKPRWFDDRTPFAKRGDGELWVRVIEKAYAERFRDGYGSMESGELWTTAEQLTGIAPESVSPSTVSDAQLDALAGRIEHHDVSVTSGTFPDAQAAGLTAMYVEKVIVQEHAYSVERIDATQNLVYLDNPHGKNDLVLTYDEYRTAFNQLHVLTLPGSGGGGW